MLSLQVSQTGLFGALFFFSKLEHDLHIRLPRLFRGYDWLHDPLGMFVINNWLHSSSVEGYLPSQIEG